MKDKPIDIVTLVLSLLILGCSIFISMQTIDNQKRIDATLQKISDDSDYAASHSGKAATNTDKLLDR